MKTKKMTFGLLGISSVFLFSTMRVQAADSQEMYRLYNPNSGEHFYTKSTSEKDNLVRVGWKFEGIAWQAPTSGTDVYRLYNPNNGDHHYTTSLLEKNNLVNVGWRFEGTGWYSDKNKAVPIYRVYNPNTKGAGSHHYTKDLNEYNRLATIGWRQENIGWYGANPSTETTYTITIKCVDEQNKVIKQSVVNSVKKGSSRSFDAEQIVGYELTSEKK